MKKILVAGGAGFIGSNFIFHMLDKYPDVGIVCLDALTYAANVHTLDRAAGDPRFKFVKGDIVDRRLVFDLFESERFDAAVNFAAETFVDTSIEHPEIFLTTNILGTQVLMDACRAFSVARFHQVSTDEVYGDLPLDRPDLLFTEENPIVTSSPYSASKAAADLLALAYHRTYGLPVTISRCSNNYGPYQHPEKLIPLMISRAMDGKRLPVYGEGLNIRDWLFVTDHCAAIDLILSGGKPGEVYNVGGGNERRNIDVVRGILARLSKGDELIEHVRDRAGHDLRYAIDASKIKRELGWKPAVDFESGMDRTVQWYTENRGWWACFI